MHTSLGDGQKTHMLIHIRLRPTMQQNHLHLTHTVIAKHAYYRQELTVCWVDNAQTILIPLLVLINSKLRYDTTITRSMVQLIN